MRNSSRKACAGMVLLPNLYISVAWLILTDNSLGKQWHAPRKAFRPSSGLTSYEQRTKLRMSTSATKAREKEMKEEKEAERQVRLNHKYRHMTWATLIWVIRNEYKQSRINAPQRRKRNDTRRWPRRCTRNESSGWRGRKSETNYSIHELYKRRDADYMNQTTVLCPAISATIAVIYRKQMVGKYALKIKDICTIPHVLHHSVRARLEEAMLIQLWAKKGRSEFITPRFAVSRHYHGVDRSGVIEGCWLKELILIKYQSYILCCTFGLLQVSSQNYKRKQLPRKMTAYMYFTSWR